MAHSNKTHDHQTIKEWTETRNGVPAKIKGTGNGNDVGVIRIHFPEVSQNSDQFQKISWEEFFNEFEKNKLDFLYQEKKEDGELSTFHKLVNRDN
jgi:anaerobic selenocysteine-containing dehydrogenase